MHVLSPRKRKEHRERKKKERRDKDAREKYQWERRERGVQGVEGEEGDNWVTGYGGVLGEFEGERRREKADVEVDMKDGLEVLVSEVRV